MASVRTLSGKYVAQGLHRAQTQQHSRLLWSFSTNCSKHQAVTHMWRHGFMVFLSCFVFFVMKGLSRSECYPPAEGMSTYKSSSQPQHRMLLLVRSNVPGASVPKATIFYLLIHFLILVHVLWVLMPLVSINGSFVNVNRKQSQSIWNQCLPGLTECSPSPELKTLRLKTEWNCLFLKEVIEKHLAAEIKGHKSFGSCTCLFPSGNLLQFLYTGHRGPIMDALSTGKVSCNSDLACMSPCLSAKCLVTLALGWLGLQQDWQEGALFELWILAGL